VQPQDDTEKFNFTKQNLETGFYIHTAIFEKVAPIAEKNMRGCFSIIIYGEPSAHQVDEINRMIGDINGRMASYNVRL
jgi:hypothetical protein